MSPCQVAFLAIALANMLPRWVLAPGITARRSGAASATKPLQHVSRHQTVLVSLANELAWAAWRCQTDRAFPSSVALFCISRRRTCLPESLCRTARSNQFNDQGHRGISYSCQGRITTSWLGKVCVISECGTEILSSCRPQLSMKDARLEDLFA